jgi:hypothetical protein
MKFAFYPYCFRHEPRNSYARQYVTQIDSVNILGPGLSRCAVDYLKVPLWR